MSKEFRRPHLKADPAARALGKTEAQVEELRGRILARVQSVCAEKGVPIPRNYREVIGLINTTFRGDTEAFLKWIGREGDQGFAGL